MYLLQQDADRLIRLPKKSLAKRDAPFPQSKGGPIPLKAVYANEEFMLDITLGRTNALKASFQLRTKSNIILVRLDINAAHTHTNPNGQIIGFTHLHIYKAEFDDRYAYELNKLPDNLTFTPPHDQNNMIKWLHAFLDFCHILHDNIVT